MFKLVSLMLVLVMCLGTFIACSEKKEEGKEEEGEEATVSTTAATEDLYDANGYLKDDLPEKADYQDKVPAMLRFPPQACTVRQRQTRHLLPVHC